MTLSKGLFPEREGTGRKEHNPRSVLLDREKLGRQGNTSFSTSSRDVCVGDISREAAVATKGKSLVSAPMAVTECDTPGRLNSRRLFVTALEASQVGFILKSGRTSRLGLCSHDRASGHTRGADLGESALWCLFL